MNEKKTQDALLEAIDIMIDNKLKKLKFNYYVDGVIKSVNDDTKNNSTTYNVLINGDEYKNIPAKNNFIYYVGDTVQILIKNGDWNKKYIDDKILHNGVSSSIEQDIESMQSDIIKMQQTTKTMQTNIRDMQDDISERLTLGNRTKILQNSDFDNYVDIGCFAVYSDEDALTMIHCPCKDKGLFDVCDVNTNLKDVSHIIQKYTSVYGVVYCRDGYNLMDGNGWMFEDWNTTLTTYNTKDYIVEQGVSGIWTYTKWSSGKAECVGSYTTTISGINTAWGTVYAARVNEERVSYPFEFIEVPHEFGQASSSRNAVWTSRESSGLGVNTISSSAIYTIARPTAITSSVDVVLELRVVGKWKEI